MDSVSLKDNDADKDESVYLISDANGNVNKTIVVDHLKNKDKMCIGDRRKVEQK